MGSKSENQGKKKQNQQLIMQQNQQQRRKSQGGPTFIQPFSSRDDHGIYIRFQRKQSPFGPLMHEGQCYSYQKYGHVAANGESIMFGSNHRRLKQFQYPRDCSTCIIVSFHPFLDKELDCIYNQWRRSTFPASFRYRRSRKRFDPLGHVQCYTYHNFGDIERYCLLPCYSRQNQQKKQR